MTDDFSVQQKQPNTTPYLLGGATVGGLGAGLGTHYYVKPKYGSYEDIIKEAEDTASFQGKIDSAEVDKKKFFDDVRKVSNARTEASKEWDSAVADCKNNLPLEEDEHFKKLKDNLAAAQKEYNNAVADYTKGSDNPNIQELMKDTEESRRLEQAKKAVEDAKKNLKPVEKTEKEIEEAVAKYFDIENVTNKEEFIENKTKDVVKDFKEKYAKELENKLGKYAGWKLAGITAGGILLGGMIGKLLAPKN